VLRALLFSALIAYALGSVPTSFIVGRVTRGLDLRQHGSGNLGATNAFRVLGWRAGLVVLLIDMAKAALAVLLARWVLPAGPTRDFSPLVAAVAVVLGHISSPWVGFRGGKGVAPAAGAFLTLAPWGAVPATLVWLFLLLTTRVMSVASIAAAAVFPICLLIHELSRFGRPAHWATLVASFVVAVLVVLRHRANIQRLRTGAEKPLWT
jgi:glycerol-3-phosphate acyltransferase PlsY